MGRKLSTVDIKGTLFEVDAFREALIEKDCPKNRIPFQVFDQEGNGYRFLYDQKEKNVPRKKSEVLEDPERYCWVIIQALMELDPEGIAMRYDIPLEILCPDRTIIPRNIIANIKQLKLPTSKS
ncbi:hypothetical protein [Chitinophaga polysaccharea]|uniref:hypothetical protein n=1 Tax=Chitinophaga polysaccharea TaxID=1293035 RepID=UPI00115B46A4|nr:hypothetical protein [Chitinophaga polysaccharea]